MIDKLFPARLLSGEVSGGRMVHAPLGAPAEPASARGEEVSLLSLAADCMSSCVIVTDASEPDNPIIYVNAAFAVMTGYEPKDAIGQNLRILLGPETDAAAIADLGQALSSGRPIRREILIYRKNGEAYWNDIAVDPIRDSQDRLIGFVVSMYDSSLRHIEHAGRMVALDRLKAITDNSPGYVFQRVLKPMVQSATTTSARRCFESWVFPRTPTGAPARILPGFSRTTGKISCA